MNGGDESPVPSTARSELPKASGIEPVVLNDDAVSSPAGFAETNELLRALLAVTGRVAFPEEQLRGIVSPLGNAAYLEAYRLCDGKTPVSTIAKTAGIDRANFSKVITKWMELGVAFRTGPKRLPLHLYALPINGAKSAVPKRGRSSPAEVVDARQVGARVDAPSQAPESIRELETEELQSSAES